MRCPLLPLPLEAPALLIGLSRDRRNCFAAISPAKAKEPEATAHRVDRDADRDHARHVHTSGRLRAVEPAHAARGAPTPCRSRCSRPHGAAAAGCARVPGETGAATATPSATAAASGRVSIAYVRLTQDQLLARDPRRRQHRGKNLSPVETTRCRFSRDAASDQATAGTRGCTRCCTRRRRGYARGRDEMTLVFVVLALGYMRGWLRSRARPTQAVDAWRAAGFLLGLALIWIAVGSLFASADAHSLTAHMVQHLVLMSVAPPLIWLADPVRLLRCALPSRLTESVVARWRPISALEGCLVVLSSAGLPRRRAGSMHVPALLALSVRSNAWHASNTRRSSRAGSCSGGRCPPGRHHLGVPVDRLASVPGDAAVRRPLGVPGVSERIAYPCICRTSTCDRLRAR